MKKFEEIIENSARLVRTYVTIPILENRLFKVSTIKSRKI